MTPALWFLLGYLGCWLHIIGASVVGARLKRTRRRNSTAIRPAEIRRGIAGGRRDP